ncbi:MAG: hypothetical protein CMN06_02865 [Roseibacillus sp.]|nr:hypothetical protein [Roseibacillus sp.]|tara:strand:+ start:1866 stop:2699 length:834 start_codon:yes stop_codon:yes gene_type:complete
MKTLISLTSAVLLSLPVQGAGADIQFASEVQSVQPGVPFTIGLHVVPQKNYHTYWKYPGIVGLPTSIEWKLPKGFHAGEISWPTPEIVDMSGHPAHGYRRELLLLVVITPPKKIPTSTIKISGDLAWMACHRECHPGFATRSIELPVNHTSRPTYDRRWVTAIRKEREALPQKSSLWKVSVESSADANPVILRVSPSTGASKNPGQIYFFSEDGQITSEPAQKVHRQDDGSYLITGTRSDFSPKGRTTVSGTLVASQGWAEGTRLHAFRVNPSYPSK